MIRKVIIAKSQKGDYCEQTGDYCEQAGVIASRREINASRRGIIVNRRGNRKMGIVVSRRVRLLLADLRGCGHPAGDQHRVAVTEHGAAVLQPRHAAPQLLRGRVVEILNLTSDM